MIEGPLSLVATILFGIVEITLLVLMACIRPFAYLLIPKIREEINKEFADRSKWVKLLNLAWGLLAVLAAIGVIWFWAKALQFTKEPKPHPVIPPSVIDAAERGVEAMQDARRRGTGQGQ